MLLAFGTSVVPPCCCVSNLFDCFLRKLCIKLPVHFDIYCNDSIKMFFAFRISTPSRVCLGNLFSEQKMSYSPPPEV